MPGDHEDQIPLQEPIIVPCLFLTGMALEATPHYFRFVGWNQTPDFGGEAVERRISTRFVLPIDITRKLLQDIRSGVKLITSGH